MTRKAFCYRLQRLIYGGFANDDAEITINFINNILGDAIGFAAKQNYTENLKIDSIGYVNNSFYTTFRDLEITVSNDGIFFYEATLPQVPVGLGANRGIASGKIYQSANDPSYDMIPLTENQLSYFELLPPVNGIPYWNEGNKLKFRTEILLYPNYKARVRMVSGGDSTDMNSELNVPPDYFPVMTEYILKQLGFERAQKQDLSNDGSDQA